MTAEERRQKIDQIRMLPRALENAVQGLNENQLDTPYRAGGWTVRQVVHHLADSHINAFVRMKLILTEEKPAVKPYSQDAWATLPDTIGVPIGVSMEILRGLHDRWCILLENVQDNAWTRTAFHPERGEITLESMLTTYSAHGLKHVEHIMSLRRAQGW